MKTKSSFAKIVLTIVLVLTCVMSFAACDDLVIKSISVTTLPTKVVYQIGEKFDPTGGKLTAVLADDKMLVIDINSAMCGDVDTSVVGKVEVKVGYLDKFATFEITVVPAPIIAKEVKDISVTTLPTKVEYVVGEAFCVLGGKITITYADGTTEIIDIDCAMCGNVDTSVADKVMVKVGYLDKFATFEITVVPAPIVVKEVKGISVTTLPTKLEYAVGEAFSALGGKITVTYADDTTEIIDLTDSMCGVVDTSVAGKATVTATYETKTATFDIAVNKITPTITTEPTTIATVTYGGALPAITGEAKDGKTVVDGVFTLVAGQKLTVAQTSYNYTFTPTDTAKYITVTGVIKIAVAPKALTITGVAATGREYDGTTVVALTGGTLSGAIDSDNMSLTLSAGSIENANAGDGKTVTYTATLTGGAAANYQIISQNAVTVNITKATYDMSGVTFENARKVYNGKEQTLAISGQLPQGVTVSYDKGFTNVSVEIITATFTVDTTNYNAIPNKTALLTIATKTLTITGVAATGREYDGTAVVALTGGTLSGAIDSDNMSLTLSAGSIENANAGDGKTVTYTATLTGGAAANYVVGSQNVVTVNIKEKALTINGVTAEDRVYDGAIEVRVKGGTLSDVIGSENVLFTLSAGLLENANVGGGKAVAYTVTLTGNAAANYVVVSKNAVTVNISAKDISVVWDSAEVVATGSAVAPNATVVTGVASETITFTVAGNTNVGKYTATAVAVAGINTTLANYSITNLTFDYTIADAFAKNTNQLTTALASAQDGSTIEVAAGTYNITVMDVVNNIIINGENIDTTILNGALNLKNGQLKNLTLTNAKNLDLLNIGNSAATKINMTNVKVLFPIFTETDNVAASNRTVAQVVGNNKADITMRGCRFVNHANNGANITKVNEWSFGLAMAAGNVGSVTIDGCAFDGTFRTMLPSLNGKVTITNNTFRNTVESVKNGPSSGAGADVTCITTLSTGAITISGNTFDNCGGFYFQTTVAFTSNTVKVDKLANFIQVSNGTAVKLDLSTDTFVCGEKTVGFYGSEANFTLPAGFTQYVGQEKINNVGWVKWNELKNVISIVVSKNPTQVEYAVGENFVATGGQITVTMKDTTTKVIDLTSAMCGVVDTAKVGTVTVTVTYETKTATFDITVSKITPTITVVPTTTAAVTYGDALPTLTGEARDGDNVVVVGVFTLDAGQKLIVAQTSYNYTFTPNDTAKYTIVTGVIKFAVAPKALTITGVTAQNKSYDGTCDVVLENGTLTGKVGKDDVTLQLGKGTAVDKNAGASVSVTYTPSLLGVDKANYVIGDKNAVTVQVDKKFVKITEVIATERPYDSTKNITISGGVIVGMISGDQLGVDLGQGTSDYAECGHADNAVSYNDAKLTLADAGNYMINEWTSTKPLVKITRREITAVWPVVTLSYKGKAHDLLADFNCDYKLTADSGIVGESIGFKDVTCDALLVAAVGKYTFTAHLISDRNFVISVASATKEYQVVESNVSKAEHYIATVDAIGTVVFTPECLAKIVAAEKEYSALAPELLQFGNVPYKHSVAVAARLAYDKLAAIAEFNNYKANDYLASDYVTITSKIATHTTNINNCTNIADIPTALSAAKLDLDSVKTNKATTADEFNKIIASASDGDNVRLGAGNFAADLVITKSISLVGQGVANTTITGSIVVSGVGKSVIIDGIKIYRETTNTSGIITITSDATVTVKNCLLEHKSAKTATAGNNTGVRMEGAHSKLYLLDTDINVSHYCVGMRNVEQFVGISGGVLTAWAAIMTSCNDLKNVATLANNKVSINTAKLVGRPPVDDDGYGLITLQQNLHGNNIELNDCKFDLDLTFHNNKFTGKDYSLFDVRSSNNVITTKGCKMLTPFAITVAIGVNGVVQNALETGVKANIYDINVFVPAEYIASIHVLNDKGEANGVDLKYSPVIKINGHNYFVVETSAQLVDAVAKAVANDTIVLVIGTFAAAVTITQPLAIVGQGLDKTIITTCTIEQSAMETTITGVTITNRH